MEIRDMLRHPFITKYQDQKLPIEIMKDFKETLGWDSELYKNKYRDIGVFIYSCCC